MVAQEQAKVITNQLGANYYPLCVGTSHNQRQTPSHPWVTQATIRAAATLQWFCVHPYVQLSKSYATPTRTIHANLPLLVTPIIPGVALDPWIRTCTLGPNHEAYVLQTVRRDCVLAVIYLASQHPKYPASPNIPCPKILVPKLDCSHVPGSAAPRRFL